MAQLWLYPGHFYAGDNFHSRVRTGRGAEFPGASVGMDDRSIDGVGFCQYPAAIFLERPFSAFISSSLTIIALVFLFSFSLFPNLVVSSISPAFSQTIYNASSSQKTLKIMAIIALIGMPFVLAYTTAILLGISRQGADYGS